MEKQPKTEVCPTCNGSGKIVNNNKTSSVKCTKCKGTGEVKKKRPRIIIPARLPLFKKF